MYKTLSTKQAVNQALLVIGENGLSGVVCEATSLAQALSQITALPPYLCDRVAAELHRQKLVEISKQKKTYRIQLSVKGVHRLQRAELSTITVPEPSTWDGHWRMVTYDVPVAKSKERRLFASELRRLGFVMGRESVWFHPHPCFSAVTELASRCGLQRHITMAEIVRLDTVTLTKLEALREQSTAQLA